VTCAFIGASPSTQAKTLTANIEGMAFGPPATEIHIGDVIEWFNRDFVTHTVTARDDAFDVVIPPGKKGRTTMKHAGQVAFFCRYHPTITGEVSVAP
jgi:plastocyanin